MKTPLSFLWRPVCWSAEESQKNILPGNTMRGNVTTRPYGGNVGVTTF